jgi:phosphoribosylaminoimidazolecarboxamide formyltransferase/IMP cyclohydrolase
MPDEVKVRRALLSVSDKSGLIDFARALAQLNIELVSTGGTADALQAAGLPVRTVESLTGFPEMMDGRLKTLHPKVHGGILALRDDPAHIASMREHDIEPIDLVCVNLYPFEATIAKPDVSRDEAIENIDIGGPTMIRAAAKNHEFVAVVTSPDQYADAIAELKQRHGATTHTLRARLAADAFARTSTYDRAIANYLNPQGATASEARAQSAVAGAAKTSQSLFPSILTLSLTKLHDLRYGENPHQSAALYADPARRGPSVVTARQLHGKELSYNNLNDAAAALALALELAAIDAKQSAAAIIKHANPCGASLAPHAHDAAYLALQGDLLAAYGGILALTSIFNDACAELTCKPGVFLEVIIAPAFTPDALERLKSKSSMVRLLAHDPTPVANQQRVTFKSIPGGALVQSADDIASDPSKWTHAAGPTFVPPTAALHGRCAPAVIWTIAKHLSSNAIAIGGHDPSSKGVRLFGAGAGQMDRVTACRLALEKAGPLAKGAIAASDAFFPFPDGPELLIRAGITTLIHPGGSKRDQETFELCNKHNVTCFTTGIRHFRH